jgi:hypothetical protein
MARVLVVDDEPDVLLLCRLNTSCSRHPEGASLWRSPVNDTRT